MNGKLGITIFYFSNLDLLAVLFSLPCPYVDKSLPVKG